MLVFKLPLIGSDRTSAQLIPKTHSQTSRRFPIKEIRLKLPTKTNFFQPDQIPVQQALIYQKLKLRREDGFSHN